MNRIKLLELFGGIGAPRKALENIGIDVKSIDYVEIIPQAVCAYNKLFDNNYKPEDVLNWNMNIDILFHGSPCVDFSTAGLNDTSTGRSILYKRTIEIIDELLNPKPKYIVWENVTGLLNKRHIKHLNHYLDKLDKLGYNNYFEVLNGKDFGIPQDRNRVFVVSIRKDINKNFNFNLLEKKPLKPITEFLEKEVPFIPRYSVVQPSMIKALEQGKINIVNDSVNTITTKQVRWNNAGLIFRDLNNYKKLKGIKRTSNANGLKLEEVLQVIPDLDIKKDLRYITEKESWRLMGFSEEDFEKVKKFNSGDLYTMAGNSIIVPVLEAIFKELLRGD